MPKTSRAPAPPVLPRWAVAAIAAVMLLVVAGGAWFYRHEAKAARARAHEQLQTIAQLKVEQIAEWRRDQLIDVTAVSENRFLIGRIAEFLARLTPGLEEELVARLRSIQRQHDYADVLLLDAGGRLRLRLSAESELEAPEALAPLLEQIRRERRAVMSELHVEPGHLAPHVTVVAPVVATGADPPAVIAFVAAVNDASRFLYPLIQRWPTSSLTAETLLVRRDGDSVLFLNQLRHQADTALRLRIPLTRSDLPAAMAVTGRVGPVEGTDYRGVPVVSVLLPVPESGWFMVAKVDASEVYADWRRRAALLITILVGLVASAGGVGLLVWQREAKRYYRAGFETEARLRAATERHSITLRSIGDAVIATDAHGRVELLNPEAERLTGWSDAEAHGRPLGEIFRIINEDTRAEAGDPVSRVLRDGLVVALANHTVLLARDGTQRPIADSGAPIRDEQGAILGVVLVFRDQTEDRAREQDLREREALLRESQSIGGLGSYVLDVATGRWSSSTTLDEVFGMGPDDDRSVAGWVSLVHPDDQAMMADYFATHVIARRQPFDRQYRIVRKGDGAERWVHGRGRLDFDAGGNPARMVGTIQDVTDQRQADLDRSALQAQLLQAQKMESVGRLAGGVAHDFNNMLGAILGYAELILERRDLPAGLREDLQQIQTAAQRSAALTGQLLAFARRQTIAPRVLDLNETIEGLLKMLRRLIGEDIELQWHPRQRLWAVRLDPGQVNQILANLCVNARDAIAGVGHIVIETDHAVFDDEYCAGHPGFRPGDYVRVTVTDDGCGMEKAVIEHLFEPFFTTKRQGEGTGLGLATVYGIVKQNEGFINVYSEPGQGTRFTTYFPRLAGEAVADARPEAPSAAARGHETVLLVEDELAILRVTGMALVNLGYEVLAAATPSEAIRLAEEHPGPIHVVLSDVVMPEMNGRDLVGRLRERRPGLACVFMSGYTADVIAHRGVLDEGVIFIQKPFTMTALAAKLREALAPA